MSKTDPMWVFENYGEAAEHYSQGICGDGAAILCDGVPLTVDEIVARLNHCHAQDVQVQICKLGMYGAAYDAPDTCRAYTYAAQPGNDIAYRLGDCLRAAHCDGGGDFIDFGLALLRRLQDKGFGVFQIAAAPSTQQKESGDE